MKTPSRCAGTGLAAHLLAAMLAGVLSVPSARAQSAAGSNIDQIARQAAKLVNARRYDEAVPYLNRLISELTPMMAANSSARRVVDFAYFHLSVASFEQSDYAGAVGHLREYLQTMNPPMQEKTARIMLAESCAMLEDWPGAAEAARVLLENRDLDMELRVQAWQVLAEACMRQEQWAEALKPLGSILKAAPNTADVAGAAEGIAFCLIQLKRYEDLFALWPRIRTSEARHNIDLNIAMIEAADGLAEEGKYPQALCLYRWVRDKEELSRRTEERIQALKQNLEQASGHGGPSATGFSAQRQRLGALLAEAEEQLKRIQSYPDYQADLWLRTANCYFELKRYWESYVLYYRVYETRPKDKEAQQGLFSAFTVALQMERPDLALRAGYLSLQEYPDGIYLEQMSAMLVQLEIEQEHYREARTAADRVLQLRLAHSQADYLGYLAGYAAFQLEEFEDAQARFAALIQGAGDEVTRTVCAYWHAMCRLFLGDFDEAARELAAFAMEHPQNSMAEDAIYRTCVALYGAGDLSGAAPRLQAFLSRFPGSPLVAEAHNLLGDIHAADGQLDLAIASYQSAARTTDDMMQITYATMQQARVLELESKWEDIIALYRNYQDAYGEEGRFTEAAYWIATAQQNAGDETASIKTIVDAIVRYGDNPHAYGIDMMIWDLGLETEMNLGGAHRDVLLDRIYEELNNAAETRQWTLRLRLQALFAVVQPARKDTFRSSLSNPANLQAAAPSALIVMGRYALENGKAAFAQQVYEHFLSEYSESDLALYALQGLATLKLETGLGQEAIPILERITTRYASQPEAGWAHKALGDALLKLGEYERAEKAYSTVLAVKEWRGSLWPEALYGTGCCRLARGELSEAFAFFQRVYVMYDGYPQWAARAYLRSAECLERLGERQQAVATYRELLSRKDMGDQPEVSQARGALKRLGEPS